MNLIQTVLYTTIALAIGYSQYTHVHLYTSTHAHRHLRYLACIVLGSSCAGLRRAD